MTEKQVHDVLVLPIYMYISRSVCVGDDPSEGRRDEKEASEEERRRQRKLEEGSLKKKGETTHTHTIRKIY